MTKLSRFEAAVFPAIAAEPKELIEDWINVFEMANMELCRPAGSPTLTVGYEAVDELPKETHESPMLSLDKTKDREALKEWLKKHKKIK